MKKFLLFFSIAFFFGFSVHATDYFISSEGNDNNSGNSQSSPWRTLGKLNSYSSNLKSGDRILFRRGDTFYGKIEAPSIGTSGSPIFYGAYGSGNKPVISGFTNVNSWNNLGGNIWESSTPVTTLSNLNLVLINGVNTPMGRYPNADATYPYFPNYFNIDAFTGTGRKSGGTSTLTSNALQGSPNWAGAEVVVRVTHWIMDRAVITKHSGSTISYIGESAEALKKNFGFFIQNDPKTLDMQNEWYFDPSTKKIRIYSSGTPRNVQVTSIDTLFNFHNLKGNVCYAVIDNMSFSGANNTSLSFNGNGNKLVPIISNCDISYSGNYGISLSGLSNGKVENNNIIHSGNGALWTGNGSGYTVTGNTIRATGVVSPYKKTGYGGSSLFILSNNSNSVVKYNSIDSSEYCGIQIAGQVIVQNNFINHSSLIKGDGAGIYTYNKGIPGRIMDGNIILNSEGNSRGTDNNSKYAFGIYLDELSNDVKVTNNTIANSGAAGIFLHASNNIDVRNNTMYDNGQPGVWGNAGFFVQGNAGTQIGNVRMNTLVNNIFFAKTEDQFALHYYQAMGSNNGPSTFGRIDSNYYAKPINPATAIGGRDNNNVKKSLNLLLWKLFSGQDAKSIEVTKTIKDASELRFEYNATAKSKTISLDANYIDAKGKTYDGSIVLEPYTSAVLIRNGAIQNKPGPIVINAGDDQEIILPINTFTLNGEASLSGGVISSYSWTKLSGPAEGTIVSPNSKSTVLRDLVEGVYEFEFKAVDNSGRSNVGTTKITVTASQVLLPSLNLSKTENGVEYKYYEGSSFRSLTDFSGMNAVKTGNSPNFDISIGDRDEGFGIEFNGYIKIPADGQYTFYTASDDGSNLFVDNQLVVDNDGLHGWIEKSGTIGLKAGFHRISVNYFQATGGKSLQVSYAGPGFTKKIVGPSELYIVTKETLLPAVNVSNLVSGISYQYFEDSNYKVMPDFSANSAVNNGVVSGFDISVASRAEQFAINYSGYIEVPADGNYTFYTASDDGSMLYIDNQLIVDNNGLHGWVEKSGTIGLKAGKHLISVGFFQGVGAKQLQVTYAGPGISRRVIPESALSRVSIDDGLLKALNPINIVNGLDYEYFEDSNYKLMPDFTASRPINTGSISSFDISVASRAEQFAINYSGYIEVPTDGIYTFFTASDDGSMLYIDNQLIVDNDGLHGWVDKSGTIGLKAGKHLISVGFFQGVGAKQLQVTYAGPGISRRVIPESALFRSSNAGGLLYPVNPINIVNGLNYEYFEDSNYKVMPDFSSIRAVKSGTIAGFDISVASRPEQFAINYNGYIEVPLDGIYTFYTGSDDGSMLYIDNQLVVDNNGLHGWVDKSGTIGLKAGKHLISVGFFQATGAKQLQVTYSGPGISRRLIPESSLYRNQGAVARAGDGFNGEALASTKPLKQQSLTNLTEIGIKAYPNPFVNSIVVSINGKAGKFQLQMMDALGRTLWTRDGSKNEGIYQQSVNTSSLQKGVYFLKIIQDNKSSVIKILK